MNENPNTVLITEDYTRAVALTRSIIANAQAAQQSLYEVCRGLKEMRDGKLYKELGYQNFEDYTENEVGIGRRHAYRYMAIAEGLEPDFVTSMSQIGTTKLALLAKLDEPTREAVTEQMDVEAATVRELQAQIAALTQERDENEHAALLLSEELESAKESLAAKDRQFQASLESKNREIDELRTGGKRRTDTLLEKIKKLTAELEETRSAPNEVAVEDTSRIEALEQELAACKRQLVERPLVQEALPTGDKDRRNGEFRAINDALTGVLEQLCTFLDENDNCGEFRSFANRAKERLREYNKRINEMLSEEES